MRSRRIVLNGRLPETFRGSLSSGIVSLGREVNGRAPFGGPKTFGCRSRSAIMRTLLRDKHPLRDPSEVLALTGHHHH
ncbi:hypothetical protein RB6319 [Rhodopirellula baltica SH 1]|uniref:Uncharacterized protein n=1 Tax=Rhodopirellula baltica (strain DSM 10527 / NCIMB 13988 / SH1) TaxID=243090 RepID=Q7UQI0_RHOBA|nr:hypothetical protein RB6319 [Rhodopirellula baltica SH 1]